MNNIIVELQDFMGSDKSIANAAWTSSLEKELREQRNNEDINRIINFLAKEKHASPFESVVFRFWINLPIFTDRQHMTHRIASHNGLSGRYRTMPTDYFDIPEDVDRILLKIEDHYPNIFPTIEEPNQTWNMFEAYYDSCETAVNNYKLSIDKLKFYEKKNIITNEEFKRCRELLRGQLPLSLMTERTSIFNLRSFANYQKLRNKSNAQKEIQIVADLMLKEVKEKNICPIAINTLQNINWNI